MSGKTLETILKLSAKLDPSLMKALQTANKQTTQSAKDMGDKVSGSMKGMARKVAGYIAMAFSVRAIITFGKAATQAAQDQVLAEAKLATVMRQRMAATDGAIDSIVQLTAAQQRLGVIGDEVQLAGAQQMATFLTSTDSLKTLIPAINDLTAQQYGLNASQENAVAIANLFGKAMNGQMGALTRVGIIFTEDQERIMKYGTEQEKAAALAEIITDNIGHMNTALAQTDFGKYQNAKNVLSDLREQLGKKLMPLIADAAQRLLPYAQKAVEGLGKAIDFVAGVITYLGQHPALFQAIAIGIGAIMVAVTILRVQALLLAAGIDASFGWIGVAITAVVAIAIWMAANWKKVTDFMLKCWEWLKKGAKSVWDAIVEFFSPIVDYIGKVFAPIIAVVESVINVFTGLITFLSGVFSGSWQKVWEGVGSIFSAVWNGLKSIAIGAVNAVISVLNWFIGVYNNTIGKLGSLVGAKITIEPIEYLALAKGMTVTQPTLAMIAEGGDAETVVPHNNRPRSRQLAMEAARGTGLPIGGNTYTFAPVIYANDATGVKQVLDDKYEQFKEWAETMTAQDRRLAFR